MTSIVCWICKELVDVEGRTIAEHSGGCVTGGMRYIPSPRRMKAGPGAPSLEVLATRTVPCQAPGCESRPAHGQFEALVRVHNGNASVN